MLCLKILLDLSEETPDSRTLLDGDCCSSSVELGSCRADRILVLKALAACCRGLSFDVLSEFLDLIFRPCAGEDEVVALGSGWSDTGEDGVFGVVLSDGTGVDKVVKLDDVLAFRLDIRGRTGVSGVLLTRLRVRIAVEIVVADSVFDALDSRFSVSVVSVLVGTIVALLELGKALLGA